MMKGLKMAGKTKIEWTDTVWNPVRGCSNVSEGCANCYAARMANRFCAPGKPYEGLISSGGGWNDHIKLVPDVLELPLRWRNPRKVFVNSMSDLFHDAVPDGFIDRVFSVMAQAKLHIFQILTKRPKRMLNWFMRASLIGATDVLTKTAKEWPLKNVWIGVSVENQRTAEERIPKLLQIPAAVRFVSCEPLLDNLNLSFCLPVMVGHKRIHWENEIDWVIVGGETGPGARPIHPDWVREIRNQCQSAGVPFFFKQWGEWAPDCLCGQTRRTVKPCRSIPRPFQGKIGAMFRCGRSRAGRCIDGRTWEEFPK